MDDQLAKVREWAQDQLDAGQEPPWATGRYQRVIALIDAMLARRRQAASPVSAGKVIYPDFGRRRAVG